MRVIEERQVRSLRENVVDISVVAKRQFPLVLTVQKTVVIPQLQSIDKVFDVSVVQVPQFGCSR